MSDKVTSPAAKQPTSRRAEDKPRSRKLSKEEILINVNVTQTKVRRLDTLSVTGYSFGIGLVLGIALVFLLVASWEVADQAGIFRTILDIISGSGEVKPQVAQWFELKKVFPFMIILGGVFTLASTVLGMSLAIIYNILAKINGGLKVTLSD